MKVLEPQSCTMLLWVVVSIGLISESAMPLICSVQSIVAKPFTVWCLMAFSNELCGNFDSSTLGLPVSSIASFLIDEPL